MSDSSLTFYDLLGVKPDATPREIQDAYRALLVKIHPDISRLDNLDTRRLAAAVNEAWLTLNDPEKRATYDELLKAPGRPSRAPLQYVMEELSDRGREYVVELEKSRAQWDAQRKSAVERREQQRLEAERAALAAQEARAGAQRVRLAADQAAKKAPAALPTIAWGTVSIAAVIVLIAAAAIFMLFTHTPPSALTAPAQLPKLAVPSVHASVESIVASAKPAAIHTGASATTRPVVSATNSAPLTAHAVSSAQPAPTQRTPVVLRPIAPVVPQPTRAPAHVASACSAAHVTGVAGPILETSGGSYRIDDPAMQQLIRTWSAGDSITICPATASDGTPDALIANGVRGSVQAVPVRAPLQQQH